MPISTGLDGSRIRVGVILREDRQRAVSLQWPSGSLEVGSLSLPDGGRIDIRVVDGSLEVETAGGRVSAEKLVLRSTDDVDALRPGDGVTVEPVRTGRGFHWQKDIRITLPGELELSVKDGQLELVNIVDVESYVACVATSEMGAAAPDGLLAAQTIVARCWALALVEQKHRSAGFDVCNDDCCQRYQGTTYVSPHSIRAARDTRGQVLVHGDAVIDARYSKNCGGLVEDYTSVWAGPHVPYLVPLWDAPNVASEPRYGDFEDYFAFDRAYCAPPRFERVNLQEMLGKVDVSGSYYRWTYDLPVEVLLRNLDTYHGRRWMAVDRIEVRSRGASARISALELYGEDSEGTLDEFELRGEYFVRQMFSESFLYSSAFEILNPTTFAEEGHIRLRGCGWGHGVGLCQMGALGMALAGRSVREIVEHYYPGAELRNLD